MKVNLSLDRKMRFIGKNSEGLETVFDTHEQSGGEETAATPMEIMLQSLAACSSMDIVSIIRKKRKTVDEFDVEIDGEKRDKHPKVFVKVHIKYILTSSDAEQEDLQRAADLSQSTYCGVAEMFRTSGCDLSYECILKRL